MLNRQAGPQDLGADSDAHFGRGEPGLPQLDLKRLLAVFRRRLRLFAAVALLVLVATVILTLRATPMYTATANLIIDRQQQQVVDTQAVLSGLPADSSTVDTEVEVLRSRQLAERVVDTLNLTQDPEFNSRLAPPGPIGSVIGGIAVFLGAATPDAAQEQLSAEAAALEKERVVDAVLSRLSIRRAGLTYVMNVGFTSEDPAKAARIANTFADRYMLEQLEAKFDATRQANTWLNSRLAELRVEVQAAEAAVAQYRAANNLLSASGSTLTEQEISTDRKSVV